jgi:hypothetical protein
LDEKTDRKVIAITKFIFSRFETRVVIESLKIIVTFYGVGSRPYCNAIDSRSGRVPMTISEYSVTAFAPSKKRIFPLAAHSDGIARPDPVNPGIFKRLMLAWQRSKQNRLELHLRLTIPVGRLKYYGAPFPALHVDDRYRHHPYIRD